MAFKLPKEPIRNRKEFLMYLAATAAGVLVALSVERAGEWWKERSQVAEARQNLREEVVNIRDQVREMRKLIPDMQKNFRELSDYTDEMLKEGLSRRKSLTVNWRTVTLSRAAWQAAEATGAAAHMDYREAKRYADLYELEREYTRMQSLIVDEVAPVMGIFVRGGDPTINQNPGEMRALGERVRILYMRLNTLEGVGKALEASCDVVLNGPPKPKPPAPAAQ